MKPITKRYMLLCLAILLSGTAFSQSSPNITYSGSTQTYTVGAPITPLNVTNSGGAVVVNGQTSTFAGGASFTGPIGIVEDANGNLYLSDISPTGCVIRKITPDGTVSTLAGNGAFGYADGTGAAASFHSPGQLAIDATGNLIVADVVNNRIRKITPAGVVTTLAGNGTAGAVNGTGTGASFSYPTGVAIDASGNIIVADYSNNLIRKITPSGAVTTLAGSGDADMVNGTGTAASFDGPQNVAIDPSGNIFVTEDGNNDIRKITPAGVVTTLAGNVSWGYANGTGTAALFDTPDGIVSDNLGNLYVADFDNNAIRKITPAGVVTTLAGTGGIGAHNGPGATAEFDFVDGITIDKAGELFVCDANNRLIRKVLSVPYTISPSLPAGLNFNTTTGTITGTPTAISSAATYTITAYNLTGSSTTTMNITVNPAPLPSPSLNQNYVITYTARAAGLSTPDTVIAASGDRTQVETVIQYIDDIGRPMQTVQVKGSPLDYDVIQPFAYDQFGRESTKYLLYAPQSGTPGNYRSTALTDQGTFYSTPPTGSGVTAITDPVSQTGFEPSPLNRPIEQGFPGVPWQLSASGITGSGHTQKMVYTENNSVALSDTTNTRLAALYTVTINSDQSRTLVASGYYQAGQLSVTISRNENWTNGRGGTTEEYKDKAGHVVLKRVYHFGGSYMSLYSTYYVYDNLGQLAFVLPPLANGDAAAVPATILMNNLCYQYRYDLRNRMIQKKLPGKGWEYTVYNSIDEPVATQDSLQRANNNWIFTKYDAMGRVIYSGIWNNGNTAISRASLQNTLAGITSNLWEVPGTAVNGYTNVAWPTSSVTATLGLNYYDSYANVPGLPATYTLTTGVSNMVTGLTVAKKTAVLNTPTDQLWDVVYYDDLGRTIKRYTQHYFGGTVNANNYDLITTTYNFTNAPTTDIRQHWNTASTANPLVTIANQYIYDNLGRKLKTWKQIANGNTALTSVNRILISQIDYNEVGQVKTKHLHSTDSVTFYQNIAYTYNERSWLSTSNAPLFSMQLYYNTLSNKAYNGNILYQYWTTPTENNYHFSYTYDPMNRLLYGQSADGYYENYFRYDLNGNITTMRRYQATTIIDDLAFNYGSGSTSTTSLQSVNDQTTNDAGVKHGISIFTYDGNGNLVVDPSKPSGTLNLSYNLLNLPQNITGAKTITYTYDATGNKLRRVSPVTNNTDYISGIQYDGTIGGTETLSFIQTEEGQAVPSGTGYDYVYYLADHLGNTRITFDTQGTSANVLQADDYYPFGMEISRSYNGTKNEYLYNKKELQEELAEYDYGARFYDPLIARWNVIDPLAEKSRRWSPYVYVENNPVRNVDIEGMEAYPVVEVTNQVIGHAQQRVLGFSNSLSHPAKYSTTTVNVYKVVVTDTEDKNFHMEFGVTRDAFTVTKGSYASAYVANGNNGDGARTASNVAFEPATSSSNTYDAKQKEGGYPSGVAAAMYLTTPNGSTTLQSTSRPAAVTAGYSNSATTADGVMFHVGGFYTNANGGTSLSGSEACFSIVNPGNSPTNTSNAITNSVINAIFGQAAISKTNPGLVQVVVDPRNNILNIKKVNPQQ